MTRTLTGTVDIRGIEDFPTRAEVINVDLRKKLPFGWRVESCAVNHAPDYSTATYTAQIRKMEPWELRSAVVR